MGSNRRRTARQTAALPAELPWQNCSELAPETTWCGEQDSNLHERCAHRFLRPMRLPVSPSPRLDSRVGIEPTSRGFAGRGLDHSATGRDGTGCAPRILRLRHARAVSVPTGPGGLAGHGRRSRSPLSCPDGVTALGRRSPRQVSCAGAQGRSGAGARWCLEHESNMRPAAYETAALPLELSRRNGTGGRVRTSSLRFWRPLLCRMRYTDLERPSAGRPAGRSGGRGEKRTRIAGSTGRCIGHFATRPVDDRSRRSHAGALVNDHADGAPRGRPAARARPRDNASSTRAPCRRIRPALREPARVRVP